MQDLFWKIYHMYNKLICKLYALLCWQNFILVKSECYRYRVLTFEKCITIMIAVLTVTSGLGSSFDYMVWMGMR
jgi:hypothetical protein